MTSIRKIAVIGAGVTGVTTAYKLLQKGAEVTLFEANPHAAMETSYANGGQLSASNAEVWNNPATLLKGVKWMFTAGAPLLMNFRPSWHKYSWLAEFVAAVPHYERNTVQTVKWAIEARAHLLDMAATENIAFDRENTGILHFYGNHADFDAARKVTEILRKGGLDRTEVTPSEIAQIEPSLKGPLVGGFYTDSDFTGDINKFTKGLAYACVAQGATFRYSAPVERLVPQGDGVQVVFGQPGTTATERQQFDQVVICAGVHSRRLAEMVGDRVNIYPVKGYSITVNLEGADNQAAAPRTSLLDDNAKIVTSRLGDDRFRVAGTAEINGANKDIVWKRIAPLVDWCRERFPEMSTESVVPWAGLRPMMPNMLPRVGPGKHPSVFYNTGHGHLGWTLSGVTAEIVAHSMTAERSAA